MSYLVNKMSLLIYGRVFTIVKWMMLYSLLIPIRYFSMFLWGSRLDIECV